MTHSGNYARDHLASELFTLLFDFIRKWTQIELVTDTPINLANTYFEIFPEDKQPMWTVSQKCYFYNTIILHAYNS